MSTTPSKLILMDFPYLRVLSDRWRRMKTDRDNSRKINGHTQTDSDLAPRIQLHGDRVWNWRKPRSAKKYWGQRHESLHLHQSSQHKKKPEGSEGVCLWECAGVYVHTCVRAVREKVWREFAQVHFLLLQQLILAEGDNKPVSEIKFYCSGFACLSRDDGSMHYIRLNTFRLLQLFRHPSLFAAIARKWSKFDLRAPTWAQDAPTVMRVRVHVRASTVLSWFVTQIRPNLYFCSTTDQLRAVNEILSCLQNLIIVDADHWLTSYMDNTMLVWRAWRPRDAGRHGFRFVFGGRNQNILGEIVSSVFECLSIQCWFHDDILLKLQFYSLRAHTPTAGLSSNFWIFPETLKNVILNLW